MKEATLHSLIIAKALLEKASGLCISEDRYLASAGLVVLQDALEIVFYALLIERGVDEKKNIDRISFDELIGELRREGIGVSKSGTLKALNKQRVLTKHYAQVAEPATVRNYFDAAQQSMEDAVKAVIGRSLADVYLSDLLDEGEAKVFLKSAEECIAESRYFDALIEIRKAIFIEFEDDYSIYRWKDQEASESVILQLCAVGGCKAPYWMAQKKWIQENVRDPLDYIQIDYERWKLDAMEWGINTAELENLRRLTPQVFRGECNSEWCIKYNLDLPDEANLSDAKYCLDRTIAVILKKQEHERTTRYRSRYQDFALPADYLGEHVYKATSTDSDVVHTICDDYDYSVREVVSGFNPEQEFYTIFGRSKERDQNNAPKGWVSGYLLVRETETG